ncbi:EscU/YscU/HrcU family type III secretion system export apparatus switch protein [Austwickia chelonae]|uniref:EscU/YscU/HrcU family type III secretion system export apparatus switch protein n=1 Tax=Austwickia chelonae TaxID=100225 RepID=UPI000E2227DC|nr:EscU/YscU/HrcU family type III secretion system export apparatus switch protein [Austwickia chelonae]
MAEDKHSKTEKPTPKRRKEAKDEGNVPKTQDLSAWLTVLAFVALGPYTVGSLKGVFTGLFRDGEALMKHPDVLQLEPVLLSAMWGFAKTVGPIAFACMFLGVMGHVVQGGLSVSSKRFKPKWKKLNPGPGLKNMFGMQGMWTLAKTLIKFVVFGTVAYMVMTGVVTSITGTGAWSLSSVVSVGTNSAMTILRMIAVTGLVIAAVDWIVEKRRIEKSLMMTKDEIKRESKMQEGDPHLKGAIKAKQREMGRRRMMAAVGESTVVMANPSHVAVALSYETGGGAPKVVAKGAGHLALRIREEAQAHDVPIVRDPITTRMLYKLCEVDQVIPPDLYDAIAQVIAFVFYLDEMGRASGEHDSPVENPYGEDLPDDLTDAALGIKDLSAEEEPDVGANRGGSQI